MKNSISNFLRAYGEHFESASHATPHWESFFKIARGTFRKGLEGFSTEVVINKGHFYFSGFFRDVYDNVWYFSISDVRSKDFNLLIRTAKDFKDYTGGFNRFLKLDENLFDNIQNMVLREAGNG